MLIDVVSKDTDGNVVFSGKLNKSEVSFVLTVGVNYLMANGAMPLFTGKDDEDLAVVAKAPKTVQ